jgi:hypothetical protein
VSVVTGAGSGTLTPTRGLSPAPAPAPTPTPAGEQVGSKDPQTLTEAGDVTEGDEKMADGEQLQNAAAAADDDEAKKEVESSGDKSIKGEDQPKVTSTFSSSDDKSEVRKGEIVSDEKPRDPPKKAPSMDDSYGYEYAFPPPGFYPSGLPLAPPKILPLPGQAQLPGFYGELFQNCLLFIVYFYFFST